MGRVVEVSYRQRSGTDSLGMRKPRCLLLYNSPQTKKLKTIDLLSPTVPGGHKRGQFLGVA